MDSASYCIITFLNMLLLLFSLRKSSSHTKYCQTLRRGRYMIAMDQMDLRMVAWVEVCGIFIYFFAMFVVCVMSMP